MRRPGLNELTTRVLLLRDAGIVKRSHTCRTTMDRNVAEHSHGVAMLVLLLYQADGRMPRAELLAAALVHDLSELATGDIPAPVKWANPALRNELNSITTEWEKRQSIRYVLSPEEAELLRWCDHMDFALYSLEEITAGNRFFEEYLIRITDRLEALPLPKEADGAALLLLQGVCDAARYELNLGKPT